MDCACILEKVGGTSGNFKIISVDWQHKKGHHATHSCISNRSSRIFIDYIRPEGPFLICQNILYGQHKSKSIINIEV